ncbi:MAG: sigma-70 family RNA polymerase sigma factor [Verrucomicrobiae bacterium]|nr:sigma-70 family RNA polymerase sigma factor [Verrucomicrobiae bacterium]
MSDIPRDDAQLLRGYAERRSEADFEELVRRHVSLVFSAVLRQVGDNPASAADVTQSVFIELARQAPRLQNHPVLSGWLYKTAHQMAARFVRSEARRQDRERRAHLMQELSQDSGEPEAAWSRIRPVLDAAMHELGETDRLAVLLRFFEQQPLSEVGRRLGLNENAARMRVSRALERLRARLERHGVTSTESVLAAALAAGAVTSAPPALAGWTASAALAAAHASAAGFQLLNLMAPLKLTAGVAALATAGTLVIVQHQTAGRLRQTNAELEGRIAQLTAENDSFRDAFTRQADKTELEQQSQAELLQLRGEVARLRAQLAQSRRPDPATVRAANPQPAESTAEDEEAKEATKQFGIRRMNEAKLLMLGFHLMAAERDDGRVESLESALSRVKAEETELERQSLLNSLQTGDYELVFQGALKDIGNPSQAIVLRERQAWQAYKGIWARTYGFADGHSEIKSSDDGDYSAWEAERQAQPATGNPANLGGN